MEQEARYLEALRQATAARVYGRQLWLETAEGLSLVFTTQ
jgi:heat shock protein HslJ